MSSIRSPATPTSKSLRDRIAKFEKSEGVALKSPVSRSPVSPRVANRGVHGKTGIQPPSPIPAMPVIAATLKPPPTPPSAFSSSSNDSGTVEDMEERSAVALETMPLAESDQRTQSHAVSAPSGSSREPQSSSVMGGTGVNGSLSVNTAGPSVTSAPSPLDALLSPVKTQPPSLTQAIGIVGNEEEDEEEGEDEGQEVRFSTVPLTGKGFDEEGKAIPSSAFSSGGTPSVDGDGMDELEDITNAALQTTATRDKLEDLSSPRAMFFKQRLEKQDESSDLNIGSNTQFKEEFTRIQNQRSNMSTEEEAEHIDWEFWGAVMADYHQFARENSDLLASAIERGIPSSLRGMMWQLMAASKDPDLEMEYARLLKESSVHEKAITRDLGRTFPHHDFFQDGQGIGQENLFNVLKAYSLYDPDVGYCQGLPFIVAVLLLNMPDEEAFCLLVRLMMTYGLRGHYLPEMPALQLRLFQFDRLVEELLPVLHVHFLRQGIKSSMFASQWFLTMFSYRFPLDVVFRIYDNVLATGIEAIFGFSLALLQKNEDALLKLSFDQILDFLRNKLFDAYKVELLGEEPSYLADLFVRDAALVRITPFMLDSYAHEYEESVREREAHATEMDNLRNINRNLSNQVKTLETNLAQLNTEHCELVKELVMARVANEEMEGELVRYKLLYADLMHRSEDAASSHRLSQRSKLL